MARERLRAAVVQLRPTADATAALVPAAACIDDAAEAGAELVLLPEKWSCIGTPEELRAGAEPADGGPALELVVAAARRHGIWIAAGSMAVREPHAERLRNRARLVSPDGEVVAAYDKLHMFDVEVAGEAYRESDAEDPGEGATVAAAGDLRVGLSVCYDLRFPELYRLLAARGADVLTVPAAFTEATGRAHWRPLLRARAIENQCAVLAAGIVGDVEPGKPAWGHSMIIDAWGRVLAEVDGDGAGVAVADIDLDAQRAIRRRMPVMEHRRRELYGLGPDGE